MKTNDILVCAYPRSGITYFGFLLMAARLRMNNIPLKPTFYNIDWLLIDSHKMSGCAAAAIWNDGVGDFYKTHAAATGDLATMRASPQVIYLLRNPVHTLASYYEFRRQLGQARCSLRDWLQSPQGGIPAWNAHVRSWLIDNHNESQSLYLIQYEDLLANPSEELHELASMLGWTFTSSILNYAVDMAELEHMRAAEFAFTDRNPVYRSCGLQFVRPDDQRKVPELTEDLVELIRKGTDGTYQQVLDNARSLR